LLILNDLIAIMPSDAKPQTLASTNSFHEVTSDETGNSSLRPHCCDRRSQCCCNLEGQRRCPQPFGGEWTSTDEHSLSWCGKVQFLFLSLTWPLVAKLDKVLQVAARVTLKFFDLAYFLIV